MKKVQPPFFIPKKPTLKAASFSVPANKDRLLERLVTLFGLANVFATLPQAYLVWIEQDASGVSAFTWTYYTSFAVIMLMYGLSRSDRPIIITYIGSTILYAIIMIGAFVY